MGNIYSEKVASAKKKTNKGLKLNSVASARSSSGIPSLKKGNTNHYASASSGNVNANKSLLQCWPCGAHDHGWRNCSLPWRRNLAFGTLPPKGETPPQRRSLIQQWQPLKKGNKNIRVNTEPGNTDVPESEIRLTEAEWIEQFNTHANNVFLCTDHVSTSILDVSSNYRAIENRIVLDSGASSSIISLKAVQSSPFVRCSERISSSTRCFRFGGSRTFNSCGLYRIRLKIPAYRNNDSLAVLTCCFVVGALGCHVPFLLSRADMARNGCILDFQKTP